VTGSTYDAVPYASRPFWQSQPAQLAAIARLFGLQAALPSTARVLELGCAAGGNMIPLAARYPQASFTGIDLAATQVAQAQHAIQALGLANIEIRQQSVADFTRGAAPFDYIICHGVYSWVAPKVQDAILRVCRENLSEHGVAFISYNTYPGWKMREVVRDTMMYHTRSLMQPPAKVEQARAILRFVEEISDERTAFGKMMREEAAIVAKSPDYYLFHEHLEANNRPCYFREFIERARAHELGFLGEALLSDMAPQRHGEKIFATVEKLAAGDILAVEQYMDFFRNRSFRQTLLVHSAQASKLKRVISPRSLRQFLFSSGFVPVRPAVPESGEELEFRHASGRSMKTVLPLLKAMLLSLAEAYPRALSYADWTAAVHAKLQGKIVLSDADMRSLEEHLVRFAVENVIQLHVEPAAFGSAGDAKPRAFAPARWAAEHGATQLSNLRHETVVLNQFEARLLALLDGNNTRAQLVDAVAGRAARREVTLMKNNIALTDPGEIRPIAAQLVGDTLAKCEKLALLS
jgi:methyltransferase-like protein/2-polyprenyl-3-methyl-5-hydroxy-6-metoxy-1,4-benzoquinol methylase